MARLIAFLRGINVGRGRVHRMEHLRGIFEALGLSNVATVIASGNVVFETEARSIPALERRIGKVLAEAFGHEIVTFIRTVPELTRISAFAPFPAARDDGSAQLHVVFLAEPLAPATARRVKGLSGDTDEFRVHGREIYWLRRRRPGGPPFSTLALERAVGKPFTVRSLKTVRRVADQHGS